jgi:hypothetical protein
MNTVINTIVPTWTQNVGNQEAPNSGNRRLPNRYINKMLIICIQSAVFRDRNKFTYIIYFLDGNREGNEKIILKWIFRKQNLVMWITMNFFQDRVK